MQKWTAYVVFYGANKQKGKNRKRYAILVVRITKNGLLINSRPCNNCINYMRCAGITKIYYSSDDGKIICERVDKILPKHVSSGTAYIHRMKYCGDHV